MAFGNRHNVKIGALSAAIPQQFGLRLDLRGGSLVGDMAGIDDVDALSQRERRGQVLLDQHDGLSAPR